MTQGDFCQAKNGIVHIIDSFPLFSCESIADVLDRIDTFSTFKQLLDAARFTPFLNSSRNNSRTVFAPTNDAFSQLPSCAADCLLRNTSRRALKALLLTHVTFPAEYNSTLALRSFVYTFSGKSLAVNVTDGVVRLTRDRIPIETADLAARNGVVHGLPRVIVPQSINFTRMCPDICTGTSPTTATTATTATMATTATTATMATTATTASTMTTTTPEIPTAGPPIDPLNTGSGVVDPVPVRVSIDYGDGQIEIKEALYM